ncbi:MAG: cytochrome c oxidase assembly protein [Actinomycetota bacterium]|nr:cytochrome c oxidase assembly protein [Actinomycetota bacterium]
MELIQAHGAAAPGASWHLDTPVQLGLACAAAGYLFLVLRLRARGGTVKTGRAWAWAVGLAIVFVALQSPLSAVAEGRSLTAHMLQHVLLMSVAAPLLLLGLYPRLLVPVTRPLLPVMLRRRAPNASLRLLSEPALTFGVWLLVLYLWHVPAIYGLALHSEPWHVAEHLSLMIAGTLFWLPVIDPLVSMKRMQPVWRIAYLGIGQIATAVLAAILVWWPDVIYTHYEPANEIWGMSHQVDQQVAGALMMVVDMVAALWATTWIALGTLGRAPAAQAQTA